MFEWSLIIYVKGAHELVFRVKINSDTQYFTADLNKVATNVKNYKGNNNKVKIYESNLHFTEQGTIFA